MRFLFLRVRASGPAWLLLTLLLAPSLQAAPSAGGEPRDLLVTLLPDAPADALDGIVPRDALRLQILPVLVVSSASPGLERLLREDPRVARVDVAKPLELHSHHALRLTRADATPQGLALPYSGRGVTVAVLDSGIDASHPDLAGRVKTNLRIVDGRLVETPGDLTGHGTHVAGIVASAGEHRGVAPAAELVGIDITDRFTTVSALTALDWLYVNGDRLGVRIVVNAWGRVEREGFDPADPIARGIDRLVDHGITVLFSASNHGPAPSSLSFEAQHPRAVTVGAVDDAGLLQSYSSRGPVVSAGPRVVKPDVVAPGEAILSSRSLQSPPDKSLDGDLLHRRLSGTSQSVPHVAGILALMLEANPRMTPAQQQRALHEAAIDLGPAGPDDATGYGLVEARDSLRRALEIEPDRGNILVTGGIDTYVETARVPPTPSEGLFGLTRRDHTLWTVEVPVKTGATRIDAHVTWSTPSPAALTLLLHDPQGRETERATPDDRRSLHATHSDPIPGTWTLHVRGNTPTGLDLETQADITLPPNSTRAQPLDPRWSGPLESTSKGPFVEEARRLLVQTRLTATAHPWVPLALAAVALAAAYVTRPTRPPKPPRPDP